MWAKVLTGTIGANNGEHQHNSHFQDSLKTKEQQVLTPTSGSRKLQLEPFKQEVRQQRIQGTTLERLTLLCPYQQGWDERYP